MFDTPRANADLSRKSTASRELVADCWMEGLFPIAILRHDLPFRAVNFRVVRLRLEFRLQETQYLL